jgi:uncharacterized OsmC-like protein
VSGEVETEEGVLVIRRISVHHRLVAPEDAREVVEAVHGEYALRCPLYRTLHRCIDIKTSYQLATAST